VRRRAARHLLALSVACAAARAAPCAAQVETGVDAGVSVVKYDGFLASGAAALTPSVAWRSTQATLAARGTLLVFESGNTSIQGLLTAATFSPPAGLLRLEIAGEAGASTYAGVAQFAHALGRVRAHVLGDRWGLWVGPLAGAVASRYGAGGASGVSAGWWGRVPAGALEVTWTRLSIGDTSYSDVQARVAWRHCRFEVEGTAGARVTSHGGGAGLFGDLAATMRISRWLEILIAGGSYPSDPVSGTIPGRFVTAGVRFAPERSLRPTFARRSAPLRLSDATGAPARLAGVRAAIEELDGIPVLVMQVAGAQRVEVMGDFTDWQPVVLAAAGEGRYRWAAAMTTGMHRFNVRLDGGPWGVPEGSGIAADEFGGTVGVLVVP
jgi:hypothetical protein